MEGIMKKAQEDAVEMLDAVVRGELEGGFPLG